MVDRIDGCLLCSLLPRGDRYLGRDRANVLDIDTLLRLVVCLQIDILLRRRSRINLVLWFPLVES